jgi:fibronectin type 3 domain-containing protein
MTVWSKKVSLFNKPAVLAGLAAMLVASVMVSAGVAASVPEWSTGFPRLAEKNALLQWGPVSGATEYKVYKSIHKDKDLKLVATVKPNRYIDKELPAGKTFYYYITAVAGGKETGRSKLGAISTPAEKVFVPLKTPKIEGAHLKTLPDGRAGVGIRWEGAAGTDLVGINIYRSTTKGKGYALVGSPSGDIFDDADVKPGTTYYYVVTSVDSSFAESKYSNEVSIEVPAVKTAAKGKEKEEVKPTRMRAAKLLFRIPAKDEDGKVIRNQPVPGNALSVAVDEAFGHIFVASPGYGGVLVYDMNGKFQYGFRKDGINGNEKINSPAGIALGPSGNIYVADYSSNTINIFDYTGKPVDKLVVDITYLPEYKGSEARLYDLAVDKEGNIYVTDPTTARIHAYNAAGKRLFDIAQDKKKDLMINGPSYVTLDAKGDIIFVNSGYSRMMAYSPEGKFKNYISKKGLGAGFLYYPMGIALGNKGEIFNASGMSKNLQAFSSSGEFLYALSNETGDGPLDVGEMKGIFVDKNDRIYIAEGLFDRISVFQLTDKYMDIVPPEK